MFQRLNAEEAISGMYRIRKRKNCLQVGMRVSESTKMDSL